MGERGETRTQHDRRERRMTQADWDAAKDEVMAVLNGARYDDGGKVLGTEDAIVLTGRVMEVFDRG